MTNAVKSITIKAVDVGYLVETFFKVEAYSSNRLATVALSSKRDLLDYLHVVVPTSNDLFVDQDDEHQPEAEPHDFSAVLDSGLVKEKTPAAVPDTPKVVDPQVDAQAAGKIMEELVPVDTPATEAKPEPSAEEPPKMAPKSKPNFQKREWSDANLAELDNLYFRGYKAKNISEILGRDRKQVANMITRRGLVVKAKKKAAVSVKAARTQAKPATPTPAAPLKAHASGPVLGATIGKMILPKSKIDGWAAKDDLRMLEAFARGVSAKDFAAIEELEKDQIVTRYRELVPDASIELQAKVTQYLREDLSQAA
ncbi:hypothetical protein [Roseobacter sp. N2S]|uniref:hypothetical protein n=1 Tax=Roseobacter sp. N2S TaxID=2663844 RepID=UPI0028574662|nr:hypothetical protein [Roseobacter sp. N2S]MDR6266557.1 hypothetical protein [Roseobacter sp. N2S]